MTSSLVFACHGHSRLPCTHACAHTHAPAHAHSDRSSEAAHGATLPTRGPELSAQEQMEGMLCRKQEMEAFNKKAANRYQPWLCCAEPVASRVSASEEGFLETS